jgi:hypothetical protein
MHVIRRALHRLAREEDGIALVMAIALMMILAVTTAGIITAGTANQQTSFVSNEQRQAFAIAQDGLAYAEGCLYAAAASEAASGSTAAAPQCTSWTPVPDLPFGSGSYEAAVAGDGVTWTMYGSGTVDGITRTVHAQANVPSPVATTETGVWNYVYADSTAGCTTWNGNVTVAVPVLVRGNLCLSGSQGFTGATLEVGGNLSISSSSKYYVGTASQPIQTVKIGMTSTSTNTCTVGNTVLAPGAGACNGRSMPIHATTVGEGVDTTPEMPCIGQPSSWDPQCTGSNNGTWSTLHSVYNQQAGMTKSGCPTNLFDNDSTLNNSDTSISSTLFGTTAYDCTFGSSSNPCVAASGTTAGQNVCELKWTPSTNTLYASGAFYFDGSLSLPNKTITYTGLASFYFTGGVTANPANFCAGSATSGTQTCTNAWNTLVDGIIMIAGCWSNTTGSTLITSGCVGLGGNTVVQFGVYCTTQYSTQGGASNMGPVLANTLSLGGGGQYLIPFHFFPPDTPTNTATSYLPASSPTNWSG